MWLFYLFQSFVQFENMNLWKLSKRLIRLSLLEITFFDKFLAESIVIVFDVHCYCTSIISQIIYHFFGLFVSCNIS